jgi:ABC-type lipoprotein export system ATPase subunit
MANAITLSRVSVAAPDGTPLLVDVSLAVDEGECVAILGRGGSGKSTLLALLDGRVTARSGTVQVAGLDLRRPSYEDEHTLRARVAFVFQSGGLLANATIRDNIGLGLAYHAVPPLVPHDLARRVTAIAEELGIEGFLSERSSSGTISSMHRRALMARALVCEPTILLADEPFDSMTPSEEVTVAKAIRRRIVERRMTVLVATHEAVPAELGAGRTLVLEAGQIQRFSAIPGQRPGEGPAWARR